MSENGIPNGPRIPYFSERSDSENNGEKLFIFLRRAGAGGVMRQYIPVARKEIPPGKRGKSRCSNAPGKDRLGGEFQRWEAGA